MKEIPLTQGKVAIVDDEWYEYLNQWKWYAVKSGKTFYAARTQNKNKSQPAKTFCMHRVILGLCGDRQLVDHADQDGLNNTVKNLRLCVKSQNARNRGKTKVNSSGFKGVFWAKHANKFSAKIGNSGRLIHLGYFGDPSEAARAYDDAARKYHGEFAVLNFPER